jgi:hypothetical protein
MKLTADLSKKIADHVKHGVALRPSAVAAGVDYTIFVAWMEKGRVDREAGKDNLHVKLLRAVEKAAAEFEVAQTQLLARHSVGFRRQDGEHQEGDIRATKLALDELQRRRGDAELELIRSLTTY